MQMAVLRNCLIFMIYSPVIGNQVDYHGGSIPVMQIHLIPGVLHCIQEMCILQTHPVTVEQIPLGRKRFPVMEI